MELNYMYGNIQKPVVYLFIHLFLLWLNSDKPPHLEESVNPVGTTNMVVKHIQSCLKMPKSHTGNVRL